MTSARVHASYWASVAKRSTAQARGWVEHLAEALGAPRLRGQRGHRERPTTRIDIPLVLFIWVTLLVRVLTDDLSAPESRHSSSLNFSGGLAVLLILVAVCLLLRRRQGVLPSALAALWLFLWTSIAVSTHGSSPETLREGVREGSVLALVVIVYSVRGAMTICTATRIVQAIGFFPALLALEQLATHTGMNVAGELRANGTFAHPNSAAMFFAIAAVTSLWRYFDVGQRRSDVVLMILFTAALIATFSIDGLITLVTMLMMLGTLRPGSLRVKSGPYVIAAIIVLVFLATPLGTQRIAKESATNVATAERGEANSSLAWRINRWKTLLPGWERSPLFGQGLGTTTTAERVPGNQFTGALPHNEYVRYLVETGIVGVITLLVALTALICSLIRKRRAPRTVDTDVLNASALAITVVFGCLVNSLADNTLLNSPTCYTAVLIVVAVLTLSSIEVRRTDAPYE